MSLSILVDNGEALISFSCTFLSNGSDLTQRNFFIFGKQFLPYSKIEKIYESFEAKNNQRKWNDIIPTDSKSSFEFNLVNKYGCCLVGHKI
ncbi:hypothetical protein BpHYR1_032719 [Brachionus plicatilis]|uniref:Uncharacterized protein n=1 Tax=Brachionus plicatilis TaxID=10195 RepID=A0A3M7SJV3_BRAPC|nr:hypothetical protein BpHYR1_032719 [Brachionus plicatilis]